MEKEESIKKTVAVEPAKNQISKYFERNGYRNGLGGCCFHPGFVHEKCSEDTHNGVLDILNKLSLKEDELSAREQKSLAANIEKLNICSEECGMEGCPV